MLVYKCIYREVMSIRCQYGKSFLVDLEYSFSTVDRRLETAPPLLLHVQTNDERCLPLPPGIKLPSDVAFKVVAVFEYYDRNFADDCQSFDYIVTIRTLLKLNNIVNYGYTYESRHSASTWNPGNHHQEW